MNWMLLSLLLANLFLYSAEGFKDLHIRVTLLYFSPLQKKTKKCFFLSFKLSSMQLSCKFVWSLYQISQKPLTYSVTWSGSWKFLWVASTIIIALINYRTLYFTLYHVHSLCTSQITLLVYLSNLSLVSV